MARAVRSLTRGPGARPHARDDLEIALDGRLPEWHGCVIAVREHEALEANTESAEQVGVSQAPVAGLTAVGEAGYSVGGILALQRSAGNGSTARLLGGGGVASPGRPSAPRSSSSSLERALARTVADRLARCPDGSCGGACECEDEQAEAAPPAAARVGVRGTGKTLGGETEYSGDEPVPPSLIELDPSAGVPDAPEGDQEAAPGADASAAATSYRPPEAPAGEEDVETEVIDESPADDVDDSGPEPEADETPEPADASSANGVLATKPVDAGGGRRNGRAASPIDAVPDLPLADLAKCGVKPSLNMTSAAAASIPLGAGTYGLTFPEAVDAKITACRSGATWSPGVIKLTGRYSLQIRLLPGQTEVTGPKGNTTAANHCDQVVGLTTLGNTAGNTWYMLRAVKLHEQQHKKHFVPALKKAKKAIVTALEAATVPHTAGMTKTTAAAALKADATFQAAVKGAQALWLAEVLTLAAGDHAAGGPTDKAEHVVVDPMVKAICKTAKAKKWAACASCPP